MTKLSASQRMVIIHENGSITGGSSKIAIQTAIALARIGAKVTYFCATNPIDIKLKNIVDEIICLDQNEIKDESKLKGAIQGIWNRKAYVELNRVLRHYGKTTIVHIHGWAHALSASIFKACKDNGITPFVTLHDYFSVCPNGGFYDFKHHKICDYRPLSLKCITCNCDSRSRFQKIYRLIRQVVQDKFVRNNRSINYIYISKFSLSKLQPYLQSSRYHYLHNPVDGYQIDKVDAAHNDKYLYIGRLSTEKGVDIFCKAVSQLKLKGLVIGDGSLKETLSKEYPDIEFRGWKTKDEMVQDIKQARCLVFPSRWYEGAPLTTEECLDVGIPCIVSNKCAAVDQIINGVNGYTFKSEDTDDLVNKILKLERSPKLFEVDSWRFEKYTLGSYVEKLLEIYKNGRRSIQK